LIEFIFCFLLQLFSNRRDYRHAVIEGDGGDQKAVIWHWQTIKNELFNGLIPFGFFSPHGRSRLEAWPACSPRTADASASGD
jgi:hypothetical protein